MGVAAVKASTAPQAVVQPPDVHQHVFPTDTGAQIRAKVAAAGVGGRVFFHKGHYYLDTAGSNGQWLDLFPDSAYRNIKIWFESAAGYDRTDVDSAWLDHQFHGVAVGIWNRTGGAPSGPFPAQGVELRGGVFTNLGRDSNAHHSWGSTVRLDGEATAPAPRGGFVMEDMVFKDTWQRGCSIVAGASVPVGASVMSPSYMTRVYAWNCGLSGATALGHNIWVSSCRFRANNFRTTLPTNDPDYFSGNNDDANTKFFVSRGGFNMNWAHDGPGYGLWNDWFLHDTMWTNNVMENNASSGLFLEANLGGNYVQHNYFLNNGNVPGTGWVYGSGNYLSTTADPLDPLYAGYATDDDAWSHALLSRPPNYVPYDYPIIDISYNVMDNYGDGPSGIEFPSGEYPFLPPHPWQVVLYNYNRGGTTKQCRAFKVHHNQLWIRGDGLAMGGRNEGFAQAPAVANIWTDPTNEWHDNEYHVSGLSNKNWCWGPYQGWSMEPYTWAQWQAVMGHDAGSTRVLI
jgi:hypothetical protein